MSFDPPVSGTGKDDGLFFVYSKSQTPICYNMTPLIKIKSSIICCSSFGRERQAGGEQQIPITLKNCQGTPTASSEAKGEARAETIWLINKKMNRTYFAFVNYCSETGGISKLKVNLTAAAVLLFVFSCAPALHHSMDFLLRYSTEDA